MSSLTGRPYSIQCILVEFTLTLTAAAVLLQGRDKWRAVNNLSVNCAAGKQRYSAVDGDGLRLAAYDKAGPEFVEELEDFATGGPTPIVMRIPIWFASPADYAPEDFALPRELFTGLKWKALTTDATGLGIGGGTISFTAASFRYITLGRERTYAIAPAFDMIEMPAFSAALQPMNGRIGGLGIFVRGVGGSLSLANLTSVNIREFQNQVWEPSTKAAIWRIKRGATYNTPATSPGALTLREDPWTRALVSSNAAPLAYPITLADQRMGIRHRPEVEALQISTVEASALTKTLYKRIINPCPEQWLKMLYGAYGAPSADNGPNPMTVRTRDRTARHLKHWAGWEPWVPRKWNIPGLQRNG